LNSRTVANKQGEKKGTNGQHKKSPCVPEIVTKLRGTGETEGGEGLKRSRVLRKKLSVKKASPFNRELTLTGRRGAPWVARGENCK